MALEKNAIHAFQCEISHVIFFLPLAGYKFLPLNIDEHVQVDAMVASDWWSSLLWLPQSDRLTTDFRVKSCALCHRLKHVEA